MLLLHLKDASERVNVPDKDQTDEGLIDLTMCQTFDDGNFKDGGADAKLSEEQASEQEKHKDRGATQPDDESDKRAWNG